MKNYIPKNKFDNAAIEHLKQLPFDAIKTDVPQLLEWLQDGHWPVAYELALYLFPHLNKMKEEILDILSGDDEQWKGNIIRNLISRYPDEPAPELMAVVKRIAEHPTAWEIHEETNESAKWVLEQRANLQ